MSVLHPATVLPSRVATSLPIARLVAAVAATLVVLAGFSALSWFLLAFDLVPFSTLHDAAGAHEGAHAHSANGFGGIILVAQARFYDALTAAVVSLNDGPGAMISLATVGFLYG